MRNIKFSASANGTRNLGPVNMGGGANLVQRSLFSTSTPILAYSQWYTPGNGSPAISTSDYYLTDGLYWSRPYDLDTMGSEGATIKAREGMRYVWLLWADHTGDFIASNCLFAAYSNDPQVLPSPTTMRMLNAGYNSSISVVDQNGYTQNSYFAYQTPFLVYNPDSAGDKFYIYAESQSLSSSRQHELALITTSDFLTATLVGPTIPTTNFNGWTSFGQVQRLGVNNWIAYSFGKADASATNTVHYKYTSTDGWVWTPDYSNILAGPGPYLTISGQEYLLTKESRTDNDYVSLLAVDANKVSLGTYTRISSAFGPSSGDGTAYPGPTYLQDVSAYEEDGVASIYVTRGFPVSNHDGTNTGPYLGNSPSFYTIDADITSNVLTVYAPFPSNVPPLAVGFRIQQATNKAAITSFGTGTGGVGTYNMASTSNVARGNLKVFTNGGLWQQFVDQYYYIINPTTAANAAPLGVVADCAGGTVTVSWNDCLPNRTYRLYRGTTAATQATLIGDVTGTSTTFSLASNAQCFIKVVTLNSGVEQGSRVVSVYSSNQTQMVNRHINRVINDGGDSTKIDITFLASVDSYLSSNNLYRYLIHWVDARFGIKESGGFITKIYCLGTTQLPRGGDYTPTTSNTFPSTTSNTSYSATSFRGTTPSWINNAASARGYFGNGRANTIQRKNEITFIAAYQRPSGTGTASLFGSGQFSSGFYLQQASGASGNITFGLGTAPGGSGSLLTATVAFASATTAKVVAGVFDGSTITAYLDGVAGSSVDASSYYNPTLLNNYALRGDTATGLPSSTHVLMSGSRTGLQTIATQAYNNSDAHGLFTGACLAVFEKGSASIVSGVGAFYT